MIMTIAWLIIGAAMMVVGLFPLLCGFVFGGIKKIEIGAYCTLLIAGMAVFSLGVSQL
jgi:hypothetical protein